jgi:monoamine oxidase
MNSVHPIQDYVEVVQRGIDKKFKAGRPGKKVVVVGAGLAGLAAASELLRAGHDPLILEAQHRVGGRIYTMRQPFAQGLYGEAGAMRIPRVHSLTMAYIDKFGLATSDFPMGSADTYAYVGGVKRRMAELQANPDLLGFETAAAEKGKLAGAYWEETIRPLVQLVEREGDAAWGRIYADFDQYSVREFLELKGWSEGMIEMFGLLNNQEAMMNSSFLELFREDGGSYYTDMCQIAGGGDHLPHAFLPALGARIRYGARMIAIDQTPEQVIVHYQTAAGRAQAAGEYAILTVPFPVLRHVEVLKPFSRPKQRAIRQLHYDASAKIFFQTRRRFWETDEGIFGGGTVTDLPIRNLYYTDYGKETGRGILLAS